MANKHGAGNEEDDESDEDTTVSLYTLIVYLSARILLRFIRYYYSFPSIIFQDEEREDLMDDFEAELERENRIRELKAKKRKLSKFSWSLQKALKLDLVTKEKIFNIKIIIVSSSFTFSARST